MLYNKLVRDKIPEIIAQQGESANIRILSDKAYTAALEQKLDEETAEFHKEKNLEELADILEVVYALRMIWGVRKRIFCKCTIKSMKNAVVFRAAFF